MEENTIFFVKPNYPHIYYPMCRDFAGRGISLSVYQGPLIIERVKLIVGPTQFEKNIRKLTIRGIWGHPGMGTTDFNTLVHSSSYEEHPREVMDFQRYGLLRNL